MRPDRVPILHYPGAFVDDQKTAAEFNRATSSYEKSSYIPRYLTLSKLTHSQGPYR